MNKFLTVDQVMDILSCSRGYVYQLVKLGDLVATGERPLLVTQESVIHKIGKTFPFIAEACRSSLHYSISQQAHHG